ncbi:MAG: S24 family peptidase [Bacillota bacterium]|nr:S24 family peptidase [Bacillota bacterium]
MAIIVDNQREKLYHNAIVRAIGSRGVNEFARHAGISAGNISKMLAGQIAKPKTLRKIADACPELVGLYEELMYAAGYFQNIEQTSVNSFQAPEVLFGVARIPVIDSLEGSRNQIFHYNRGRYQYLPYDANILREDENRYFFYQVKDEAFAPKLSPGDYVLMDYGKEPQDGDIVLIRIKKKTGLLRRIRLKTGKIIVYGDDSNVAPDVLGKSEAEIFGVAIGAILKTL